MQYLFAPPNNYALATAKPILSLKSSEELVLIRYPKHVSLESAEFNFRRGKVRLEGVEWNLLSEESGQVQIIQPRTEGAEMGIGTVCRRGGGG
jgi:SH3-like domain-containing protein